MNITVERFYKVLLLKLDIKYLNKLIKNAPTKTKGLVPLRENTNEKLKENARTALAKGKNPLILLKKIESGLFSDMLTDLQIDYSQYNTEDYRNFLCELRENPEVPPFEVYIFLLQTGGIEAIERFFLEPQGIQNFEDEVRKLIEERNEENEEEIDKFSSKDDLYQLKKEIIALEKKNKMLEQSIFSKAQEIVKLREKRSELNKEKKILIADNKKKIEELKAYFSLEREKIIFESEHAANGRWGNEKKQLEEQIANVTEKYERSIQELKKQIDNLQKKISKQSYLGLNTQVEKHFTERKKEIETVPINKREKILLIGTPMNIDLSGSRRIYKILGNNPTIDGIEKELAENKYNAVWIIDFQIVNSIKREIEKIFAERIRIEKVMNLSQLN